jgi:hypothetical protein
MLSSINGLELVICLHTNRDDTQETEGNMLFNKPLTEVEESDLQTLVDNVVREGREIEYKEALTIHSDEQKQEFLNDVS